MENNRIDLCAPEGETPIYDQIRQELAGRIRAGSLPDGTRLPTVRELSEQLHVAEGTVKRAYDELERDGLIQRQEFLEVPVRVEYRPTERCRTLLPILEALSDWAEQDMK